jgi:filamentous hemagglutinin family protein
LSRLIDGLYGRANMLTYAPGQLSLHMNANFKKSLVALFTILIASSAYSNPALNSVVSGNVSITQTPTTTTVSQSSEQAIINWNSFNIAAGEKTQFVQPHTSSVALNRIDPTQGVSQIYGSLSSNGKIILINGAGIHFGPGSAVNVGGMIASTSDITDANFLAGNYKFTIPSISNGSIVNEGTLIATQHGLIALLGSNVQNNGMIQAEMGNIVLGTGSKFTLDFYGDQLINFSVDQAASSGGRINNTGTLLADGGKILVSAQAAENVVDNVINMSGVAQARSVRQHKGEIILSGGNYGTVSVSGKLNVSGRHQHTQGGTIKVLGAYVNLLSTANLNASGDGGGGTILVGGNFHGTGPEQNALATTVDAGAVIKADAITSGNGGSIAVWSVNNTQFHGYVSAAGGVNGGNGGTVETSGHSLDVTGAKINLSALSGLTGTWLLDPADLTICSGCVTSNTLSGTLYGTGNTNSYLAVSDLVNALSTANIIVQTSVNGSGGNGDIFVNTDINWNSGNTLTLSAYRNITINNGVTLANSAGGSLILQANNIGAFSSAPAGGEVINNGSLNLSGGGAVNIYYNPTSYSLPVTYNNAGNDRVTSYMLINSLGSSNDSVNTLSLGAFSNPANSSATYSGNFALSTDINAANTTSWNSGHGYTPVNFGGNFDGQNHVISNLYINTTNNYVAFFSVFNNGGTQSTGSNVVLTINNLGITNATIINTSYIVSPKIGILVAAFYGNTASNGYNVSLDNDFTSGSITASGYANTAIGGLVGDFYTGSITNSYSTATINGTSATGGGIGGIAGTTQVNSTIRNSYFNGTVNGGSGTNVGGITGLLASSTVSNSYNLGTVNSGSGDNTGGLIGVEYSGASVANSYSAGMISNSSGNVGGVIGSSNGSNTNVYWDKNVFTGNGVGTGTSTNIVGLTTAQLKSGLPGGLTSNNWAIITNQSYPYLTSIFTLISGVTGAGAGATVTLAVNGSNISSKALSPYYLPLIESTTTTLADGSYYFLETHVAFNPNDKILTYLSGTGGNAVTLAPTGHGNITGLNLYANNLQIGSDQAVSLSTTDIINAINGTIGSGILYSSTVNSINLASTSLNSTPSTNLIIDDNIIATGSANLSFGGNVAINSDSVITSTNNQTYDGAITATNNIQLNASTIFLNGRTVTSAGSQTYNAPLILGADTTLTGNSITLNNGATGNGKNLTANSNSTNGVLAFLGNLVLNIINANGVDNGSNTLTVQSGSSQAVVFTSVNSGYVTGSQSNQFNFSNILKFINFRAKPINRIYVSASQVPSITDNVVPGIIQSGQQKVVPQDATANNDFTYITTLENVRLANTAMITIGYDITAAFASLQMINMQEKVIRPASCILKKGVQHENPAVSCQ